MPEPTIVAPSATRSLLGNHPLDHPIWSALTTQQRSIAEGELLARRYPLDIAPFGAVLDTSPASFAALRQLAQPADSVAMFTVERITPPVNAFEVVRSARIEQMVGFLIAAPSSTVIPVPLGAADVPEMLELVELTRPGPFGARTLELGNYLGIRVGGKLVAMVGERMKLDGYTEISAVCTHPDFRGLGYSHDLVATLSRAVQSRGEIPFLHVFGDNKPAIALYRKLGFRLRQTMQLTVVTAIL